MVAVRLAIVSLSATAAFAKLLSADAVVVVTLAAYPVDFAVSWVSLSSLYALVKCTLNFSQIFSVVSILFQSLESSLNSPDALMV